MSGKKMGQFQNLAEVGELLKMEPGKALAVNWDYTEMVNHPSKTTVLSIAIILL